MYEALQLVCLGLLPLAVGILARYTEGSWVAPSAFFAFLWALVALPAGLVFREEQGIRLALLWIFVSALTVWAGALAARPLGTWQSEPRLTATSAREQLLGLWVLPAMGILAGLMEVWFIFARQGYSLVSVLSYAAITQLTATNRSEYIYGDLQQGTLERVAQLVLYLGTIFAGALFRLSRSWIERVIGVAPLALTLLCFGLYGSRMGALYGGSFWVGSYLAATILAGDWKDLIGWRFLLRVGVVAGLLGFGFSVGTQVIRYSAANKGYTWQAILGDGVSFVAAFGLWFKDHVLQASDFVWGGRVFRKLVTPFGLDRPIEREIQVGFTSSNIFTVLRDIIEDFGTFGALLFLFIYGMAGRILFCRVARGSVPSLGLLTLVYAFGLTSVAFSIFSYTVTSAAVIGFIIYCTVAPNAPRRMLSGPGMRSPADRPDTKDSTGESIRMTQA